MIRNFALALILVSGAATTANAQTAPAAAGSHYTSKDTDLGTLLDDPAAKAVLDKDVPGLSTNDQVDMARGMTLEAMQQYAPDTLTDATLAKVDADLAKLPPRK